LLAGIYNPNTRRLVQQTFKDADSAQAQAKAVERVDTTAIETDWRTWLRSVGPRTFSREFSTFHAEFWDWYWRVTNKLRNGEPLTGEMLVFLALWARGFGKSAHAEWAAIAEGALLGRGYVLYVSGTQSLADGHVSAIRERLESPEIEKYYPGLASPQIGRHGNQFGWRQNFLRTQNGWAIRPIGLDVGVRGGRVGDLRPTLIIFDDVDSEEDSPLVVKRKMDIISRSIIPAGGPTTRILGPQNLIHRNSVFNQIFTRRTSILTKRLISGPYPAFLDLEKEAIRLRQTDNGPEYYIDGGRPAWPGIDLEECEKFLNDSGPESFLAEYQHDFSAIEEGRVLPEYDENVHVITWSQFANKFNARAIPAHWEREIGHDIGFTTGHLSAWTWVACAAQNSGLAGRMFRYRGLTFSEVSIDDQAQKVGAILRHSNEFDLVEKVNRIKSWQMSHEKLGERKTYKEKYGFPFVACKSGKTDGLQQWRHYLRIDRSQPHPFHRDEKLADGQWRLGAPAWFDIVADDQVQEPRDDDGLATHRRQTRDWKYAPDRLSVTGMVETLPFKADEDTCDATRMITARWSLRATEKTHAERVEEALPASVKAATIDAITNPQEKEQRLLSRQVHIARVRKQVPVSGARPRQDALVNDTVFDPLAQLREELM